MLADDWTWTKADQGVVIDDDGLTYVMWEGVKDGQTVRLYVQTGLKRGRGH